MHIAMTQAEIKLFVDHLQRAKNYLEFGSGGSTVKAAQIISGNIYTTDSSTEWLENVLANAGGNIDRIHTEYVDIGQTKEWGYPVNEDNSGNFNSYSTSIWSKINASEIDLFLIDGRFRVACFAECIKHARPDATFLFHDYISRPQYHVVETIAKLMRSVDDLAVFTASGAPIEMVAELADRYRFIPN